MIAQNHMGTPVLQNAYHLVGKAVFVDAVAQADQCVDLAHKIQCLLQPGNIAVDI